MLVAVGECGIIITSQDGRNWRQRYSNKDFDLRSIIWSGKNFISGGKDGDILVSNDGINWLDYDINLPEEVYRHRKGPSLFKTHGRKDKYLELLSFFHIKNTFVGVYNSQNIISSDGTSWQFQDLAACGYRWTTMGAAWSGSEIVLMSGSGLCTSVDGIHWKKCKLPALIKHPQIPEHASTIRLDYISWNGGEFVAVSSHNHIITSKHGVHWKTKNLHAFKGTSISFKHIASNGKNSVAVANNGFIYSSP